MNPRWWGLALALAVHALVLGWPVTQPQRPRAPSAVAVSLAARAPAPSPGASALSPSPSPVEPSLGPSPDTEVEPSPGSSEAPSGQSDSPPSQTPGPAEAPGGPARSEDASGPPAEIEFDFDAWATLVRQGVDAHKSYPYAARSRALEGRVTVSVSVAPEGNLAAQPRVTRSSGYAVLDRAAVSAVNAAAPFPEVPPGGTQELELTLVFTLR